ncbi:MAG: Cna B-type domain-containing protein [Eubacteriales bacterium]|nr:Cna B-type domain-containing protein [Eubacteriales bacterium]
MAYPVLEKAHQYTASRKRRSRWQKVVTGMAAVVVFCTTYALILPAITLEREPLCGLEEHTHTDSCYSLPMEFTCRPDAGGVTVVHTHSQLCYDRAGQLICPLPEILEHVHDESCYEQLPLPEPHTHGEGCYREVRELTCPLEETEPHTHDESCMGKRKVLLCTIPESEGHTHSESCRVTEDYLVCGQEESQGHTHGEGCRDEEGNLICGQEEFQGHTHSEDCWATEDHLACGREESQGHTHGEACWGEESCYVCGREETGGHCHTDACYTVKQELICTREELAPEDIPSEPEKRLICTREEIVLHTHTDQCWDQQHNLICEKPEVVQHVHTDDCLSPIPGAQPVLTCPLEAHEHTDACLTDPEADLETPADWEAALPGDLTGKWAEDLLRVAESQLDYQESVRNVLLTEEPVRGYTRYGAWVEDPYGDWSEYFVSFCQHYAGIPEEAFPRHPDRPQWCRELEQENWGIYLTPDRHTPAPGDTVYLDLDADGEMDHMAIVEELLPQTQEEPARLAVIGGDLSNRVQREKYDLDAPELLGYASLAAAKERYDRLTSPQPPAVTYYCGQEEHTHGPACYDESGTLICQKPEHTHTEACQVETVYYCGQEAHTHGPACYDESGTLICQTPEHTHTEACQVETVYYCGQEEHTHGPACYDGSGTLICQTPEHTHTEACQVETVYYCGLTEHVHSLACHGEDGTLICGLTEHLHTTACRYQLTHQTLVADILGDIMPFADFAIEDEDQDGDGKPKISVTGELPEGAKLTATKLYNVVDMENLAFAYDLSIKVDDKEYSPVPGTMTIRFALPGITDNPTKTLKAFRLPPAPQAEEAQAAATLAAPAYGAPVPVEAKTVDNCLEIQTSETGVYVATAENAPLVPPCPGEECGLDDYLRDWVSCTGINPFGTAQGFNLFLLGNMNNWGVVHGNAAISGNITGTSNSISYDEGSSHNYAADTTEHYPIGLILGGEQNAETTDGTQKDITVRNGTVVAQYDEQFHIQMDLNLDTDHRHEATEDKLAAFFANATSEQAGSLIDRNQQTFDYAEKYNAEHEGTVEWLSEKHFQDPAIKVPAGATKEQFPDNPETACDLILSGTDPFYNVFSVPASWLAAKTTGSKHRTVYLNVPFGSYTVINVVNDMSGEEPTVITDFAPQLWYQDSDGKWISQPAKHTMENYTQTQRTLINFDPDIEQIDIATQGQYIYASILAPNATLHVPENTDINLHGTIVLGGLNCDKPGNPSAIIENPFQVGGALTAKKTVVCDSAEQDHDGNNCTIAAGANWTDYYADVTLQSLDGMNRAVIESTIKGLPLDGTIKHIDGVAPGKYRVSFEQVYKYGIDNAIVYIENDTGTYYIMDGGEKQYCDADGTSTTGPVYDLYLGHHAFSGATFNNGGEMLIIVQSGESQEVTITNHYDTKPSTQYAVQKLWMEQGTVMIDNVPTKVDWVIDAPPNANVEVTLYQKDSGHTEKVFDTCILDNSNNWYHSWTGLPKTDTWGYDFIYSVKETTPWPGYTHDQDKDVTTNGNVATVKNWKTPPQPQSLKVDKVWFDENGYKITDPDALDRKTLSVSLYRREGQMRQKDNNLNTVTVKLNGKTIGGPYPYFPGSEVTVMMKYTHWGEGTNTSGQSPTFTLSNGNKNYQSIGYTPVEKGTMVPIGKENQEHATYALSQFNLGELHGDVVLTVKEPNYTGQDYSIIMPGEATTPTHPLSAYVAPAATFSETPTSNYIDWENFEKVSDSTGTVTLPKDGEWTHTWDNLPPTDGEGTFYQYFVFEEVPDGYEQTYIVDGRLYPAATPEKPNGVPGMTEGFITIQNRPVPYGPELPMTGSVGTTPYTLGGLLTMGLAVVLMQYNRKKRRKEESSP